LEIEGNYLGSLSVVSVASTALVKDLVRIEFCPWIVFDSEREVAVLPPKAVPSKAVTKIVTAPKSTKLNVSPTLNPLKIIRTMLTTTVSKANPQAVSTHIRNASLPADALPSGAMQ
jgi:hypothetical protein